jgi:hypothetical protein
MFLRPVLGFKTAYIATKETGLGLEVAAGLYYILSALL